MPPLNSAVRRQVKDIALPTKTRPVVVGFEQAIAVGDPSPPNLAVPIFQNGSLEVELYRPKVVDHQQPHSRDEIYVVASGSGQFWDGSSKRFIHTGTFIFVPAGQEHRFEDFTSDFAVWVFFYGPEGGETSRRAPGA